MKRVSGKNKLAIIALAVMIGVAGYMSFAGTEKDKKSKKEEPEQVEVVSYDGQNEDVELNGPEDAIGDAVLTSAVSQTISSNMAAVKLTREQSRSKSRETLMDIIGDEALSDEAKKEAADTYVKLNDTIEMETDIETALAAKGYEDVVVTLGENTVDVTLAVQDIDDTEKAQIEDIVTRKTGYNISNVAISVMGGK